MILHPGNPPVLHSSHLGSTYPNPENIFSETSQERKRKTVSSCVPRWDTAETVDLLSGEVLAWDDCGTRTCTSEALALFL